MAVGHDFHGNFGKTTLLLGHARSAFKDEGIAIENNMPFYDERYHFIFNGELRGVRLREEGRIGAEKIFNYIKRINKGDLAQALKKSTDIIRKRTSYIKAMNIVISDREQSYVFTFFNEDPDYFTMYYRVKNGIAVVCSESLDEDTAWKGIENDSIRVFQ